MQPLEREAARNHHWGSANGGEPPIEIPELTPQAVPWSPHEHRSWVNPSA